MNVLGHLGLTDAPSPSRLLHLKSQLFKLPPEIIQLTIEGRYGRFRSILEITP